MRHLGVVGLGGARGRAAGRRAELTRVGRGAMNESRVPRGDCARGDSARGDCARGISGRL